MDQKEFISIIREHKSLIYKICNSYGQPHDKEDLEQEILLQLWESMDKYDGRVKLSTWIYKVALNTAITQYRKANTKKKNKAKLHDLALFNHSEYDFEKDEYIQLMYRYIAELRVMDKALILLYLDQYKYEEIASIIGISKTNVATKLNRIKKSLRQRMAHKKL